MKCPRCKNEITTDSKFCAACGTRITSDTTGTDLPQSADNNSTTQKATAKPRKKKSIFVVVAVLCVIGIASSMLDSGSDTQEQQQVQTIEKAPEKEETAPTVITADGVNTMIAEAIEDSKYDLEQFKKVDTDLMFNLLVEKLSKDLPESDEATPSTYYDWADTVRYCDIADACELSIEQKMLFVNYREKIDQVVKTYKNLNSIYDQYGGKDKMETLHKVYNDAEYMDFYIQYAMDNNILGTLGDLISGKGNMTYFYANDVEYNVLLGELWGEEDYCIATSGSFPERGAYTLLVVPDGTTTLEDSNGFQNEVSVYTVIEEDDVARFKNQYNLCQQYRDDFASNIREARSLFAIQEDANLDMTNDVVEDTSQSQENAASLEAMLNEYGGYTVFHDERMALTLETTDTSFIVAKVTSCYTDRAFFGINDYSDFPTEVDVPQELISILDNIHEGSTIFMNTANWRDLGGYYQCDLVEVINVFD